MLISQVVCNFYSFQKLKNKKKPKKKLDETGRGRKKIMSKTGQNRDTFWVKSDTIWPLI